MTGVTDRAWFNFHLGNLSSFYKHALHLDMFLLFFRYVSASCFQLKHFKHAF